MVGFKPLLLGVLGALATVHAYESDWGTVEGNLKQVSYDGKTLCGTNSKDEIYCATTHLASKPNWRKLDGGLKWVVVWGDYLWGVNKNDNIYFGYSSGKPRWKKMTGLLKQITTDGKQICGVNANNKLYCADSQITTKPTWRQFPGTFTQVDLTDGIMYATAPDGSVWYGMTDDVAQLQRLEGELKDISFDGELLCGVNAANNVFCADDGLKSSPNWRQIEGKLTQLDVEAGRIFGVNENGKIFHKWLTPPPEQFSGWRKIEGGLTQIDFDGKTACGTTANEDVFCATEGFKMTTPNWRQVPGKMVQVVVWGEFIFGVNRQNEIFSGMVQGDPEWRILPGSLKQISTDGKQLCGVNAGDQIWCADSNITMSPNWRKLPGSLQQVVVSNGVLFGVNSKHNIYAGLSHGQPKWKKMNGLLKNLSYDGVRLCGTNRADMIYCISDGMATGKVTWKNFDGKLSSVSVDGENLFGVSQDSTIFHRVDL